MPKYAHLFQLVYVVLCLSGCNQDQVEQPIRSDIVEAVYASGSLLPKGSYNAQAPISGVVKTIHPKVGDKLKKGDPILTIEAQEIDAQLQEARERLAQAQARLRPNSPTLTELQEQIELAQAQLDQDKKDYERYKRLWDKNAVARNTFENAKLKKTSSERNLARSIAARDARKNQLQSELTAARGAYNLLNARETNFLVRSKIDGRVYEIYPEVGELVSPQQALANVGQAEAFYIELQIDEADINKVTRGQNVIIRLENYAEQRFDGKVTRIYPLMDAQNQTFRVDVALQNPPKKRYPGISVEANIITGKREKALLIKKSLVHPGDSVWVKGADGDVRKRKITTGISDMEMVEVTDGLSADDEIYETQP